MSGPIRTDEQFFGAAALAADGWPGLTEDVPRDPDTLPHVLSVWTAFPMGGSTLGTLYFPVANDVRGIGLDTVYTEGGAVEGTFPSAAPPLLGILLHNDVTALPERAAKHQAPADGYGQYLFLLELSHVWGPAAQIPGDNPGALIGFPFHWSFWMDAGNSPAGGMRWRDEGDGRFTAMPIEPAEVQFTELDLYLMGLAPAEDVSPFSVLEDANTGHVIRDPLAGGNVSRRTFPWFSTDPVTVTATRREITIDDIIEANGPREPAYGEAPTTLRMGIVLVLPEDMGDEDALETRRAFEPFASTLAGTFERATTGLGTLELLTTGESLGAPPTDAGAPVIGDAGVIGTDGGAPDEPTSDTSGSGCTVSEGTSSSSAAGPLALVLALFAARLRRHRRRDRQSDQAPRYG